MTARSDSRDVGADARSEPRVALPRAAARESRPPPPPIVEEPSPNPARLALHLVYDAAWWIVIALASPWWLWRCARSKAFRSMAAERLGLAGLPPPRDPSKRRLLVHGVSVGEVKGARSLVRAIREHAPELEVVISTTTDTGLAVARATYPDLAVVRFPLDLRVVVRRFMRRVDPACVVLVELEIWPSFMRSANRRGIPLAVVNGRITGTSHGRYRWFKGLLPQFNRLTLLCVQDEDYARRFRELSADPARILITGNIKVDGLRTGTIEPRAELRRLLGGRPGQRVIVAGSTHAREERWVALAAREGAPDARLVIVPRHPERATEIVRELASLGREPASIGRDLAPLGREPADPASTPQLLSSLRAGELPDPSRPAIVDTIGELEHVYALADLVFVGGSLVPHGGQNMLEPAAQGRPVVFGPHVWNFAQEVALLRRAQACVEIAEPSELAAAFGRLLGDPDECGRLARAGIAAVEAQKGATALTLSALFERCLQRAPA